MHEEHDAGEFLVGVVGTCVWSLSVVHDARRLGCNDIEQTRYISHENEMREEPNLMPSTHRRRRRDLTVELRLVGVGGVYTIRN